VSVAWLPTGVSGGSHARTRPGQAEGGRPRTTGHSSGTSGQLCAEGRAARATLRLKANAVAALENGDIDGDYAAACDAYRMAAEALLTGVCVCETKLCLKALLTCARSAQRS
jgi:hypothetical protein